MKFPRKAPWLPMVVAALAILPGCDDALLGSPHFEVAQGIVEWEDAPGSLGTQAGGSEGDASSVTLQARIEAPDTVQAGVAFTVQAVTLGPSACWREDGATVNSEGNRVEIIPWDRMEGPPQAPCALLLGELPRQLEISFPEPGQGTIVLKGRRVVGTENVQDPNTGESHELELSVVVVE